MDEPLQEYTRGATCYKALGRLYRFYLSFANNLRIVMVASPCPNCGIMVSKNGGCPHMKCVMCSHEYYWRCKGSYTSYRHDQGMEFGQSTAPTFLVYVMIAFLIGIKLFSTLNLD